MASEMSRNIYGDALLSGINGRGVDIAVQRADDLDRLALDYLSTLKDPKVLDIGCGVGGQSLRMAKAGASVVGVDLQDFSKEFSQATKEHGLPVQALTFTKGHIADVLPSLGRFDAALSQRAFHYFPYSEALSILQGLRNHVSGKLFISVTGLGTEIARGYPDATKPVTERFCNVAEDMAQKHHIHEFVCLYTPEELGALLISAGWKTENVYLSPFGNVKAVAE
jgi:SAM-dependent methyltransferase